MQPARRNSGKKKQTTHDEGYWQRLRDQFKTCNYDHSGAYSQYHGERSPPMVVLATEIEKTEQVLLTDKHQELRKMGYFGNYDEPRKRLRPVRSNGK